MEKPRTFLFAVRNYCRVDYKCKQCPQKFGDPDQRCPRIPFPSWSKIVFAHVVLHHANTLGAIERQDPQRTQINEYVVAMYS